MATTNSAKAVVLNTIFEEYNFVHGFLRRVIPFPQIWGGISDFRQCHPRQNPTLEKFLEELDLKAEDIGSLFRIIRIDLKPMIKRSR